MVDVSGVTSRFSRRVFELRCTVLLACAAVGCATSPPVQEMSDARQAIAAAREAGAASLASAQLAEAEQLLDTAETYLATGSSNSYWQAHKAAISAKEVAFEALLASRNAYAAGSGGTQP